MTVIKIPSESAEIDGFTVDGSNNLLPDVDNSQELGSAIKTFENAWFTDDNNSRYSILNMLQSQSILRNNIAVSDTHVTTDVTASVWTITLHNDSGTAAMLFVVNKVTLVKIATEMVVDATAFAGTDANPKDVYIYIKNVAGVPTLTASNTDPNGTIDHVRVGHVKAGTVNVSSIETYEGFGVPFSAADVIAEMLSRMFDQGALYKSGFDYSGSATDMTVSAGVTKIVTTNLSIAQLQVSVDGLLYIKSDGTYNTITNFSFGGQYGDGGTIGNNKFFNIIIGVLYSDSPRLMAVVQKTPGAEYGTLAAAFGDEYDSIVERPSSVLGSKIFIPVCRSIAKNTGGTYALQEVPQSGSGLYGLDARIGGAGGAAGATIANHDGLAILNWLLSGHTGTANKIAGFDASGDADELTIDDLLPMTTQGDIIKGGASGAAERLAKGTAGQVLTMNTGATDPEWADVQSGSDFVTILDDDFYRQTFDGTDFWEDVNCAGAGTLDMYNGTQGTIGEVQLYCTGGTANRAVLTQNDPTNGGQARYDDVEPTVIFDAKLNGTTYVKHEFGLCDGWNTNMLASVAGCGFRYHSTDGNASTIKTVTNDGTTEEIQDLGIAIPLSKSEFKIVWASGSVKFYIDGVLKSTHTTNIPGDSNKFSLFASCDQLAAVGGKALGIDRVRLLSYNDRT